MKRNLVALTLVGLVGMLSFTAHAGDTRNFKYEKPAKSQTSEENALLLAAQNCDGAPEVPYLTAKARRELQMLVSVEAGWSPEVVRAIHMR